MIKHVPVLLEEVMEFLDVRAGGTYIDGTLGGGGYTKELLERSAPDGTVLGIDLNKEAIEAVRERFGPGSKTHEKRKPSYRSRSEPVPEGEGAAGERLVTHLGNFCDVAAIARLHNIYDVSGVVFDLGLSSDLLERSGRGFSFKTDEPLLMTFSGNSVEGVQTAMHVINTYDNQALEKVFRDYGEERQARKIAQTVVEERKKKAITTSGMLARTIENAVGRRAPKTLARIFQAVRIEVNDEIAVIRKGLVGAWEILGPGGRVVVVSYHSLEDREVKNFFKSKKEDGDGEILTPKPMRPKKEEIERNPRSRSAKLRAIKKVMK